MKTPTCYELREVSELGTSACPDDCPHLNLPAMRKPCVKTTHVERKCRSRDPGFARFTTQWPDDAEALTWKGQMGNIWRSSLTPKE